MADDPKEEPSAPPASASETDQGAVDRIEEAVRNVIGKMFGDGTLDIEEKGAPKEKDSGWRDETPRQEENRMYSEVQKGIAELLKRSDAPKDPPKEKAPPEETPKSAIRRVERFMWGSK